MSLEARLARVALLSMDLDGTLTDGGLYYTEDGGELRKYHVRDGMGIKMVQAAGIQTAIITMSTTPAITRRAERLAIEHLVLGSHDKVAALTAICQEMGTGLDQVAHIGDDVNDLPLLRVVGCPVAVGDAIDPVKAAAIWVTPSQGGRGAVRDLCDRLLAARSVMAG